MSQVFPLLPYCMLQVLQLGLFEVNSLRDLCKVDKNDNKALTLTTDDLLL